jgi:lysyl-tRNA synthetase class 2
VPQSLDRDDRDEWLNLLLINLVEPHLGRSQPTILCDYPASQAALARIPPAKPFVSERFELYCHGIELANGYHELLDADELAKRHQMSNDLRERTGRDRLPEPSWLLAAMRAGLPHCTGVALGVDRLIMLIGGYDTISQVIPFPMDRA